MDKKSENVGQLLALKNRERERKKKENKKKKERNSCGFVSQTVDLFKLYCL